MTDIDGSQSINVPLWIIKTVLKNTKNFKCSIGITEGRDGFIKISFGKWNILTMQINR